MPNKDNTLPKAKGLKYTRDAARVECKKLEKAYDNQRAAPPEVSRICSARSTLAGWWGAVLTFVLTAVKSLPGGVGKVKTGLMGATFAAGMLVVVLVGRAYPARIVDGTYSVVRFAALLGSLLVGCTAAVGLAGVGAVVGPHGRWVVATVLFLVSTYVDAVKCPHCKDQWDPPGHAAIACPLITTAGACAASIAAGAVVLKGLDTILPTYVARLFPRAAIQSLVSLLSNPTLGTAYSFTRMVTTGGTTVETEKDFEQVVNDFQCGLFSKNEAIAYYSKDLRSTEKEKREMARDAVATFRDMTEVSAVATSGEIPGAFRYVLARVSEYVVVSRTAATAYLTIADDVKGVAATGTSLRAPMHHPKTASQFYEILNLWLMVVHAAGMANVIVVTTFLQDVVHHPIHEEGMEWHMAYCLMAAYLIEVERERSTELPNVYGRGSGDRLKARADRLHEEYYGSLFGSRGQPARGLGGPSANPVLKYDPSKGYNKESKIPCVAWNLGQAHHPAKLNPDGSCPFLHRCGAFLTGPDGKCSKQHCLGEHQGGINGAKCTNPAKWCKPCA